VSTNPRYANGHRRRQLRARVLASEDYCAWDQCPRPGIPVDKTVHYLDPWAPEVDEIIPVSQGGDPLARSNTRLMHRWCNQQRWATRGKARATTSVTPVGTSRAW